MSNGDLADRVSRTMDPLEGGFPLDGDFLVRLRRSLYAGLRIDPELIGRQMPRLKLGRGVNYEVLLLDASLPPFRGNGRGFSVSWNFAAQGVGNFSLARVYNNHPSAALVMASVLYNGGAVLQAVQRFPGVAPSGQLAFDLEDIARGAAKDTASLAPSRPSIPQILTTVAGGASTVTLAGLGSTVGFVPTAGGQFALVSVVWPGEEIAYVQQTANLPLILTAIGQLWDFGTTQPTS